MMDDSSSEPSGPVARGSKLAKAPAASSAETVLSGCNVLFKIRNTLLLLYLFGPGLDLAVEVSLDRNALTRPDFVGESNMLSSSGSKSLCNSSGGAVMVD